MATFSYVAVNNKNEPINGTIEGTDRSAAIDSLAKQGLRPVSIKEATSKPASKSIVTKTKVKNDHLVIFTRQLSAMIGAGVPILRALSALRDHITDSPQLKDILSGVIGDVEAGSTLASALAKYPDTFNDVYVNMVRAGEAAGILEDILSRLAVQQEKSTTMKKKIRSSMAYPLVLIAITILAFFGLMFLVIPQIEKVLKDLGGQEAKLPLLTQIMLDTSHFVQSNFLMIFGIVAVLATVFFRFIKTKNGKYWFHSTLLKIPIVKVLVMKIAVARFARTFSALMQAGVAVLEAIEITSRSVGNAVFERTLVKAETEVKNGKSLSSVIEASPEFPSIVPQMLLVGEETGQTDKILVKVADFYEEEVDIAISSLSSIIEPVMIVVMGGMVGLIAASVMLPIASLAQNIKG